MIRVLCVALLAVFLVGCGNGKVLVREDKTLVVMPPESLFNCPDAPVVPEGGFQKQSEVADWVLRAYQNHQVCRQALKDVREYLEEAQKITTNVEE